MNKAQSYAIIVALIGAALLVFCASSFSAPINTSNVITAGIDNLRPCGFLLGLAAVVGGAFFWLCAK